VNEPDFARIDDKLDALLSDVRTLKRHVIGDSDPEHSLMYRVADHARQLDDIKAAKKSVAGIAWTALGTAATAAVMWGWTRLTNHQP
jgi:3-deoxy-D-arabino-heptulosonate 7-phosphate (DAHP) synthase class II